MLDQQTNYFLDRLEAFVTLLSFDFILDTRPFTPPNSSKLWFIQSLAGEIPANMPAFGYHGLVLACFIAFAAAEGANAKKGGSAAKWPVMTPEQIAAKAAAESRNREYGTNILITLGAVVVAFGFYYLVVASVGYIRTLTCINNNTQRYFKLPPQKYALIKKHLIYAPLFRSRHNREFRMFSMNLGVLPTRVQTLLMIGILAMNVTYCFYEIPWQGPRATLLEQLRNRSGVLAVMNMVPLVLISGRNNPLIVALNLSFDNFNRFHRFQGRLVAAEAVLHASVQLTKMVEASMYRIFLEVLALTDCSGMGSRFESNSGDTSDYYRLHGEYFHIASFTVY